MFGFEFKIKTCCRFGGPGGTKGRVPPVWSQGSAGTAEEKIKRFCLEFYGFILMFKTKALGLMSL